MPRRTRVEDEWDDEDDFGSDADEDTVPCPWCGRAVLEDSPRCPYCENYLSREDAPPARQPWWIILCALAGLYAVYRWITGG